MVPPAETRQKYARRSREVSRRRNTGRKKERKKKIIEDPFSPVPKINPVKSPVENSPVFAPRSDSNFREIARPAESIAVSIIPGREKTNDEERFSLRGRRENVVPAGTQENNYAV